MNARRMRVADAIPRDDAGLPTMDPAQDSWIVTVRFQDDVVDVDRARGIYDLPQAILRCRDRRPFAGDIVSIECR